MQSSLAGDAFFAGDQVASCFGGLTQRMCHSDKRVSRSEHSQHRVHRSQMSPFGAPRAGLFGCPTARKGWFANLGLYHDEQLVGYVLAHLNDSSDGSSWGAD
jgi:hypothetical protein